MVPAPPPRKKKLGRVTLRKLVPPLVASVVAKFEKTLRDERFGNVLNQSFTGHKLKTVNEYAIDIIS